MTATEEGRGLDPADLPRQAAQVSRKPLGA